MGDFTARIGDPTGKNKSRPPLNEEQIKENAKTYVAQLSKILDISKCSIRYNSEWLNRMNLSDSIQLLSQATVAQMMHRNDFSNRFEKGIPIALHELIYPLLQGYDSVEISADIEMGGTDQLFNCSVGRQLQEGAGKAGQAVLCMPLLKGTDGSEKMSKSQNNIIGLTDHPNDMFGKIMSIPDDLIVEYLKLVTDFTDEERNDNIQQLNDGLNPMFLKKRIGFNVVKQYHGLEEAHLALDFFENQFQKKSFEEKTFAEISISTIALLHSEQQVQLIDLCKIIKQSESKSNLKRLIEAGSVTINGSKVMDMHSMVSLDILPVKIKIGKRDYFQLIQ
ncbi:MAG: tyrosine--tRNA ligase [Sporocytophaga sp.]|nr:tyrosine--tRNA ligase [Sporocytophaga sp.]